MRKGFKIFVSIFSALILALIIFPVTLSLLLNLSSVQNFAVRRVARALSARLETTVTVDHVDVRLFNRLSLDGMYVADHAGDTLLYVANLQLDIARFGILRGYPALGHVELNHPVFNLRQDTTGVTNLRRVLDKIQLEQPRKKGFRLEVSSLTIHDMTFRYRTSDPATQPHGINFTDLAVTDFNLKARRFVLLDDSLSVSIRRFSLREQSGFAVDRLTVSRLTIARSGIRLRDLEIETPDSRLAFDRLYLDKDPDESFRNLTRRSAVDARIENSRLSLRTIGYFVPALYDRRMVIDRLTMDVRGSASAVTGRITQMRVDSTEIALQFSATGLPDIQNTRFTLNVERFDTQGAYLEAVAREFTPQSSAGDAARMLRGLGRVGLTGRFDGRLSDFTARAAVLTSIGEAGADLVFIPSGKETAFRGDVQVTQFDLGALSGNRRLGLTTLSADVGGTFGGGAIAMKADAEVPLLTFGGYDYRGITMRGEFENRMFNGQIRSDDPNMRFDFDGRLDFNDPVPAYDFLLHLYRADLHALHLNERDSVSVVQGTLSAQAAGNSLNNLNGTAVIRDLLYVNHIDSVSTGDIRLTARNDESQKYLSFASAFADAEFRSRHSYGNVFDYLSHALQDYLPDLSATRRDPAARTAPDRAAQADRYYVLRLNVKEANNVAGILVPGLQLAEGTNLSLVFNPDAGHFSLALSSEYIEREKFFVSNLDLNTHNQGDSLTIHLRSDDLYTGGVYLPNLSVIGGAKNNRVNVTARFADPVRGTSALVGVAAQVERDTLTDVSRVRMRFTPSYYTTPDRRWRIAAREITLDSTRVAIDRFRVVSEGQELAVNGAISRSVSDTLRVTLTDFDLTPLSQLTSREGYLVSGMSNGHVQVVGARGDGQLSAAIRFDSVRFNRVRVPSARFESRWDFAAERARFRLFDLEGRDTVMRGYFSPKEQQYRLDFNLRDVDLSLLDPKLTDVLHGTSGEADARLVVAGGPKQGVKFNGTIHIPRMETTVDYLNVRYSIRNVEIALRDNVLWLDPIPLHDPHGNRASFEMKLDMNYLRNIVYDIRVRAEDALVLNTTEQENDLFSGRVFASGTAHIKGSKSGTMMNISAATSDHSTFYMAFGGASSIAQSDFVVFQREEGDAGDTPSAIERRKERFQQRRRQRVAGGGLNLNMAIDVRPNVDFHLVLDPELGDGIRARGNAAMNLHVHPRTNDFTMYGDYELVDGTYNFVLRNIINKNFTIQPGSAIRWTGEPANPLLDITAVYKLKASLAPLTLAGDGSTSQGMGRSVPVEVDIRLGDRLLQPAISFNVRVPNADAETQSIVSNAINTQEAMATQVFWLMAANTFYSDNSGQRNIGAMLGSATGFELLSSQLSNWVSSERYNIGIRYRPRSELTSDEIELGLSTQLFNSRLLLEMEGNFDFANNPTMTVRPANNLTGDFYLTWLIDRGGNFRARAFTRTIERFDENQGLQETGIGIYYKEDFDRLGDVVRNFRQRLQRKRKPLPTDNGD